MNIARSSFYKAAAVLLAALLVGFTITIYWRKSGPQVDPAKQQTAKAVAAEMQASLTTFRANRQKQQVQGRLLPPRRDEVKVLIEETGRHLQQSIESTRPGEMGPLKAWLSYQIQGIQGALAAAPGTARVAWHGDSTPHAVAAVASRGERSSRMLAAAKAAPEPETISVEAYNSLLDRLESVITHILTLAKHQDLWVRVWVGSSPQQATFTFWPYGQAPGAVAHHITTDGDDEVLRGLWRYKATLPTQTNHAVTEVIEYNPPVGASQADDTTSRLDLVNGTSFFCCRFEDHYCQHVVDEKACPP